MALSSEVVRERCGIAWICFCLSIHCLVRFLTGLSWQDAWRVDVVAVVAPSCIHCTYFAFCKAGPRSK